MNNNALDRRVKKHILAKKHSLFIPVIPGLEEPALKELQALGLQAEREEEPGSILTEGSIEDLWKIAYQSRCASRLYLRLHSFKASGFREFRDKTEQFPWELYLTEGSSYRLRFSLRHCRLHVSDNIGKSLNRSIRDRFKELEGRPPELTEVKGSHAAASTQTFLIRGVDDRFSISLDAGGGPLYDRGYRQYITEAPLRETMAASLLIAAGITPETTLIDPMCGSGTFRLEALGITAGIPSGRKRTFPFEYWPSFRPARYKWLTDSILTRIGKPCSIYSTDINQRALDAVKANQELFSGNRDVSRELFLGQSDFFRSPCPVPPETQDVLLILNPPYGKRLELKDRLAFFRKLGDKIQRDYKGVRWGIILPGLDAEKAFGLRWEKKYLFKNGGIPVSFLIGKT